MRNRFSAKRQDQKAFTGTVFPYEKKMRDIIFDEPLDHFDEETAVPNVQESISGTQPWE